MDEWFESFSSLYNKLFGLLFYDWGGEDSRIVGEVDEYVIKVVS